jgi:hypothetical protein
MGRSAPQNRSMSAAAWRTPIAVCPLTGCGRSSPKVPAHIGRFGAPPLAGTDRRVWRHIGGTVTVRASNIEARLPTVTES